MKNWNAFSKRIIIDQAVITVYKGWATQKQIEKWFLEEASYQYGSEKRKPEELVQKGDRFYWKWNNWNFIETGQVLEANGKDFISFTFGAGGKVNIKLSKINGMTEVLLTQSDIPTDETGKMEIYVGCSTAWTFWLTNLKAFLEHDITLHATGLTQEETKDLVNS